jgi:hypothetical protein
MISTRRIIWIIIAVLSVMVQTSFIIGGMFYLKDLAPKFVKYPAIQYVCVFLPLISIFWPIYVFIGLSDLERKKTMQIKDRLEKAKVIDRKLQFSKDEIQRLLKTADFRRSILLIFGSFFIGLFLFCGIGDYLTQSGVREIYRNLFFIFFLLYFLVWIVFMAYVSEKKYIMKCPSCKSKLYYKDLQLGLSLRICRHCNAIIVSEKETVTPEP